MKENYNFYDSGSTDAQLIRYLVDELKWHFAPTTGDYSNVMAHRARLQDAARLCRDRGQYRELMGQPTSFMADMADLVPMIANYEIETKRISELRIDPMINVIKAAYCENQNLHCFNWNRMPKKALECLERQTVALREVMTRWRGFEESK